MSNIRLFHPENIIENTTSLLSKEHTHYVVNVMRMKRGSNINFFNKDGEWLSEIVFLDRDRVEVKFLNKLKEPTKNSNIELAICLVKKVQWKLFYKKLQNLV
jgi:RsmE family RNA methyltransferase